MQFEPRSYGKRVRFDFGVALKISARPQNFHKTYKKVSGFSRILHLIHKSRGPLSGIPPRTKALGPFGGEKIRQNFKFLSAGSKKAKLFERET